VSTKLFQYSQQLRWLPNPRKQDHDKERTTFGGIDECVERAYGKSVADFVIDNALAMASGRRSERAATECLEQPFSEVFLMRVCPHRNDRSVCVRLSLVGSHADRRTDGTVVVGKEDGSGILGHAENTVWILQKLIVSHAFVCDFSHVVAHGPLLALG
jgi:hypothetical protein